MAKSFGPGVAFALLAFGAWGVIPLYWRMLGELSPLSILACRVVFSLVFVAGLLWLLEGFSRLRSALRSPRTCWMLLLSSVLIAVNWFVFIGAIQWQRLSEASLGYFINPLMSVALGVVVLREKLRPLAAISVAVAGVAVVLQVVLVGQVPWIALVLSSTFALYGLVRKTVSVGPTAGLFVESAILFPVALVVLVWESDALRQQTVPARVWLLAALSGPITALPLVWFSRAARELPLSMIGLFQYLAPSCQFLLAVWIFEEPMPPAKWVAFGLIWLALACFSYELLRGRREGAPA